MLGKVVEWFTANGLLDTSMRTLAAGIGTSNRMLNYHFGSREQLLAVVIERVCEAERDALDRFVSEFDDPVEAGREYSTRVADTARCSLHCSTSCRLTRCTARTTPRTCGRC